LLELPVAQVSIFVHFRAIYIGRYYGKTWIVERVLIKAQVIEFRLQLEIGTGRDKVGVSVQVRFAEIGKARANGNFRGRYNPVLLGIDDDHSVSGTYAPN